MYNKTPTSVLNKMLEGVRDILTEREDFIPRATPRHRRGGRKRGRPYTKPPNNTPKVRAKKRTRRKMAYKSRRINRKRGA